MPPLATAFTAHEQAVLDAAVAFSDDKSDENAVFFKQLLAAHDSPVLHEDTCHERATAAVVATATAESGTDDATNPKHGLEPVAGPTAELTEANRRAEQAALVRLEDAIFDLQRRTEIAALKQQDLRSELIRRDSQIASLRIIIAESKETAADKNKSMLDTARLCSDNNVGLLPPRGQSSDLDKGAVVDSERKDHQHQDRHDDEANVGTIVSPDEDPVQKGPPAATPPSATSCSASTAREDSSAPPRQARQERSPSPTTPWSAVVDNERKDHPHQERRDDEANANDPNPLKEVIAATSSDAASAGIQTSPMPRAAVPTTAQAEHVQTALPESLQSEDNESTIDVAVLQKCTDWCRGVEQPSSNAASDAVQALSLPRAAVPTRSSRAEQTSAARASACDLATEFQTAMQSTIRNAGPTERRQLLVSMVRRVESPENVPLLSTFVETEFLAAMPCEEWSATLCASEMVDRFFVPLVSRSGSRRKSDGTVAIPAAAFFARTPESYSAVAKLAAAVFAHRPTVSVFATTTMRDKFLLPLARQVTAPRDVMNLALVVKQLSSCEEGRRILMCKPVRAMFLAFADNADARSLPAIAAALAKLTTGREKDPTARKLFATPTFRDDFFIPLAQFASTEEGVLHLATALSKISAMDCRVFATSSMRDVFIVPLGRVVAKCTTILPGLEVFPVAEAQLLSRAATSPEEVDAVSDSDNEDDDDDRYVTSLMIVLSTMNQKASVVFATYLMYACFFVPLVGIVKSPEALDAVLWSFEGLARAPDTAPAAEELEGIEAVMMAAAERATTAEMALVVGAFVDSAEL